MLHPVDNIEPAQVSLVIHGNAQNCPWRLLVSLQFPCLAVGIWEESVWTHRQRWSLLCAKAKRIHNWMERYTIPFYKSLGSFPNTCRPTHMGCTYVACPSHHGLASVHIKACHTDPCQHLGHWPSHQQVHESFPGLRDCGERRRTLFFKPSAKVIAAIENTCWA